MSQTRLPQAYRQKVLDRFARYVQVGTSSREAAPADRCPSTPGQLDLARLLHEELVALGASDVVTSEGGYVYATIPSLPAAGVPVKLPIIGLMAHLDTSEAAPGAGVRPRVIESYDGSDIAYPDDPALRLTVAENPVLKECVGHTLVTASGRTLLGADDKAGLAETMTLVEYLLHEGVPHGELRLCFNPDEEIGRGMDRIDLSRFHPDFAVTLDGGKLGEIEGECFNAATATVVIKGTNVHPGEAKDKLVDAALIMSQVVAGLPAATRPEHTEGREPYLFPYRFDRVDTEECRFQVLLRAFDLQGLAWMEEELRTRCTLVQQKYPGATLEIGVEQKYRNMKAVLDQHPEVMRRLREACEIQGVKIIDKPIRGGTDGATLSIRHGIPTPNVWAGGVNMHSRLEWISLEWMVSAIETMVTMIGLYAGRTRGEAAAA